MLVKENNCFLFANVYISVSCHVPKCDWNKFGHMHCQHSLAVQICVGDCVLIENVNACPCLCNIIRYAQHIFATTWSISAMAWHDFITYWILSTDIKSDMISVYEQNVLHQHEMITLVKYFPTNLSQTNRYFTMPVWYVESHLCPWLSWLDFNLATLSALFDSCDEFAYSHQGCSKGTGKIVSITNTCEVILGSLSELQGPNSIYRCHPTGMGNPIVEKRRL